MAALTTVLGQIRSHESSAFPNPYAIRPEQNIDYPKSHASGAYQFQPGTWRGYTAQSGIGTQYSEAYKAPPQVQDAVAAWVVTNKGTHDWTPYSGAVSQVTNIDVTPEQLLARPSGLAGSDFGGSNFTADPTMSFNPGFTDFTKGTPLETTLGGNFDGGYFRDGSGNIVWASGDPASGNVGANAGSQGEYGVGQFLPSGTEVTGDAPGLNLPFTSDPVGAATGIIGAATGANSADNQWWQKLLINIQDLSIRAGLGLLALVLIAAGAWAFASGSAQEELRKLARVSK